MDIPTIYNRKHITVIFMVTILVLVASYGYARGLKLILGPKITINTPLSGATYNKAVVEIKGRVDRISKIYLNDRQMFTDDNGNFSEQLLLMPGYNILTLRADDLFERSVVKKLELIYLN